ncbi:AP-1 complex subunit sigma-3 [Meleagris gallopavo]|uniref:Adaptor related protein complex 1 subunit sigma 3 n=1 Tax=Meleagris gallopavo TaxID=9103 RepID=A0A803XZI3_MELGA|nr:AP-1 complex subunit sigma-3 [Meleagris gallopavo]
MILSTDLEAWLEMLVEIHFILLFSRQGKLRLQKWYTTLPEKEKKKIVREIVQIVLSRNQKTSSFVDWKDLKLVYKRYASLYFCCAIEEQDNELLTLEVVHRYVELLDRYFGNVSFTLRHELCFWLTDKQTSITALFCVSFYTNCSILFLSPEGN